MGEVHHMRPELTCPSSAKFRMALDRIDRKRKIAKHVFFMGLGMAAGGLAGHFMCGHIWPFFLGLFVAATGTALMPGHGEFQKAWEDSFTGGAE